MIRYITLLIFSGCLFSVYGNNRQETLLHILDKTLSDHKQYIIEKEEKINKLKTKLNASTNDLALKFSIQTELYLEYRTFRCDSAIHYLDKNLKLAQELNDERKYIQTGLQLTYLFASSAFYADAAEILNSIENKGVPEDLLPEFYICKYQLYNEQSNYTIDRNMARYYKNKAWEYADSLINTSDTESEKVLGILESRQREERHYGEALKLNDRRMEMAEEGSAEYATITYFRSLIYKHLHDPAEQKTVLILSAITDLRLAIKDHASLSALADILYSEGDVNRAYRYIMQSFDDANFYNARLRAFQISSLHSIINKTYQQKIAGQNAKLRYSLILISILLALLCIALFFIYKQMSRLSIARNKVEEKNKLLHDLNQELSTINTRLNSVNQLLSDSNHIKEEYIGHFLSLCSDYLEKMENYRKRIGRQIKNGKIDELLKSANSTEVIESELKEFYTNFDHTFLQIYPSFVEEFNLLLEENEAIKLKRGELLNTELRIFALIRLGIEDSGKIAEFLRYSANTIYNYRAKIRNKSRVPRDDFEKHVLKIGVIDK